MSALPRPHSKFDGWEKKSSLAYAWIKSSSSETAVERIAGVDSSLAAFMIPREWHNPTHQELEKAKMGRVFLDSPQ